MYKYIKQITYYPKQTPYRFWRAVLAIIGITLVLIVGGQLVKSRFTPITEPVVGTPKDEKLLQGYNRPDVCGLDVVLCENEVVAEVTKYIDTGTMASGKQTYVGAVACPRKYNLGTKVMIGGEQYTCEDRTNVRLDGRWDLFTDETYEQAMQWGKQTYQVTIIK